MFDRRTFLTGATSFALTSQPSRIFAASQKPIPVGICADLWKADRAEIDRTIDAVRRADLKFVRWDMQWRAAETTKGRIDIPPNWDYLADAVVAAGAQNIGILCYGNKFYDGGDKPTSAGAQEAFVRFSVEIARHFRGRVQHYEVWNEWDTKNGGTSYRPIEAYINLLSKCYPALKNADSEAMVMAGNFSEYTLSRYFSLFSKKNYLNDFLQSDAGEFMDCFSVHPYVRGLPLDMTLQAVDAYFLKLMQALHSVPKFRDKPVMITEMGWQTGVDSPEAVDVQAQVLLLNGAVELATKYGFQGFCIFKIRDGSNDGYGLYDARWKAKPSAGLRWNYPGR